MMDVQKVDKLGYASVLFSYRHEVDVYLLSNKRCLICSSHAFTFGVDRFLCQDSRLSTQAASKVLTFVTHVDLDRVQLVKTKYTVPVLVASKAMYSLHLRIGVLFLFGTSFKKC